ncbi:MAG: GTP diphosphokinase [Pseudomonadales bacterium]
MVQVRKALPQSDDGAFNCAEWLERLALPAAVATTALEQALRLSEQLSRQHNPNSWSEPFQTGVEMVEILAGLQLDQETLVAALLYRQVREKHLAQVQVNTQFGESVGALIEGVLRMAIISQPAGDPASPVFGQIEQQAQNVRKMLVAMIDDVRIALIKLAERTCAIRAVKNQPQRRDRVARAVRDIYVPLAHRLGIGHIKWELEDLSFRYLEPDVYQQIATLLDEKRLDRQRYIDTVIEQLNQSLSHAGVSASVSGRAKHIFSIWRKMRRKGISFSQVYDVRAVRVLANTPQDCYAALGIVHMLWRSVPNEFDDYIANPKANGYRSLHTAVIGPEDKVLEVQIRTQDMHAESEFGVCAHWQYKGAEPKQRDDNDYNEKIAWLRQVLEWHDEMDGKDNSVAQFGVESSAARIYVFTPEGHVVDLPNSATPLDFAYHIHTEIGHRCRGAKVNGRIVPLTYVLKTGEQVEVITGSKPAHSRDWLRSGLGFTAAARSRAKIKQWFKQQAKEENTQAGRLLVEREFQRLALTSIDYKHVAQKVNCVSVEGMYAAVGAGDVSLGQVLNAAQGLLGKQVDEFIVKPRPKSELPPGQGIRIGGVGNLLSHLAGCCKPVPGDAIIGYVTIGRGVTVHRQDCARAMKLLQDESERIVEVSWDHVDTSIYPVDIVVEAFDRPGLLNDVTALLANEKCNLTQVNTRTDQQHNNARMHLSIEIGSLALLGRLLAKIDALPNVYSVSRVSQG